MAVIKNAQFLKDKDGPVKTMKCNYDGVNISLPLNPKNRHYADILRQVEAEILTIAPADEE